VFVCRLSPVDVAYLIGVCLDGSTCCRWWLVLMDAVRWVRLHHHPQLQGPSAGPLPRGRAGPMAGGGGQGQGWSFWWVPEKGEQEF